MAPGLSLAKPRAVVGKGCLQCGGHGMYASGHAPTGYHHSIWARRKPKCSANAAGVTGGEATGTRRTAHTASVRDSGP